MADSSFFNLLRRPLFPLNAESLRLAFEAHPIVALMRGKTQLQSPAQKPAIEPTQFNFENFKSRTRASDAPVPPIAPYVPLSAKGFNKGGEVKKRKTRASRGDGCATKGFTKGRMY